MSVIRNLILQNQFCRLSFWEVPGFLDEVLVDLTSPDPELQMYTVEVVWRYVAKDVRRAKVLVDLDCMHALLSPIGRGGEVGELAAKCFEAMRNVANGTDVWERVWIPPSNYLIDFQPGRTKETMFLELIFDTLTALGSALSLIRFVGATVFAILENQTGYLRAIGICSAVIAACVYLGIKSSFPKIAAYVPQATAPTTWADSLLPGSGSGDGKHYDHVWVKGDMLFLDHGQGPAYCNACSSLVVQGLCCLVCRRCSHEEHLDLVRGMPCKKLYTQSNIPKLLRLKRRGSKDSINSVTSTDDTPPADPVPSLPVVSDYHEHQWVEGNLSLGAHCAVCTGSAGSEPTLKDMRCIWCDISVHTTCFTQYKRKCPLGPLSHLVVPPQFVTRISSAVRGANKKPEPRFSITDLPEGIRPLLCIVNPASGAQNSGALLRGLFAMLNPVQIIDTSQENPEALIRAFEPVIDRCRVLVCGGDGTIQWAISILDKVIAKGKKKPPVGVLPLGTGNDLARVLGWGGGWTGRNLADIVREIDSAVEVQLDRWSVTVIETPSRLSSTEKVGRALKLTSVKPPKSLVMNNYFSVGTDASVALDFHTTRLRQPQYFRNRFINKVWYAMFGGKHQFQNVLSLMGLMRRSPSASVLDDGATTASLSAPASAAQPRPISIPAIAPAHSPSPLPSNSSSEDDERQHPPSPGPHEPLASSTLYMDNKKEGIDLSEVGALLVLNIPSYGGGGKIYAQAEADGHPPSLYTDRKLEVLSVASPLHLGASVVGLSSPTVLGQAGVIRLHVDSPAVAMQVDGEPWLQNGPAEVTIRFLTATCMLRKATQEELDEQ
ncbi:hypothetical protein HKX48_002920 [Thoreauomyces humboldtii]|nr:hypothetical protein HKX48_002920 [Thoreauomyces humboldtii]